MAGRTSIPERDRRRGETADLIVAGKATATILRHLRAKYSVSEQTACAYVKAARREVLPSLYNSAELSQLAIEAIARAEARCEECLDKIKEVPPDKAAPLFTAVLGWYRHIAELQGLTANQRAASEIAALKDEIARHNQVKEAHVRELTLEHFNRIRAVYGQRQFTAEEYEARRQKLLAQQAAIEVPVDP